MIEQKELIDFMSKQAPGVSLGLITGIVHYLYNFIHKKEVFSFSRLIINMIIAGWVGYLCQEAGLSAFYTGIACYGSYPLLNLLETKGIKVIFEKFLNKQ